MLIVLSNMHIDIIYAISTKNGNTPIAAKAYAYTSFVPGGMYDKPGNKRVSGSVTHNGGLACNALA
jgi:hypothetical protein